MADLLLHQPNMGTIDVATMGHDAALTEGLETAVILSLLTGGANHYWGNIYYPNKKEYQLGGRYNILLYGTPIVPETLLRLKSAAEHDLQWLLDGNHAKEVRVEVSYIDSNTLNTEVLIRLEEGTTLSIKLPHIITNRGAHQ